MQSIRTWGYSDEEKIILSPQSSNCYTAGFREPLKNSHYKYHLGKRVIELVRSVAPEKVPYVNQHLKLRRLRSPKEKFHLHCHQRTEGPVFVSKNLPP